MPNGQIPNGENESRPTFVLVREANVSRCKKRPFSYNY